MKRTELLAIISLVTLTGVLVSCTLGEPVMPNPPPGQPVAQEIGTVIPVPDPIPHTLEGRGECFTCHAIGAVEAPSVPADHEYYDVAQCTTCHAVWIRLGIAAIAPPAIPHKLQGREDCLTCHKMGSAGAPRVPENHTGLPSNICRSCHLVGEEVAGGRTEAVVLAPDIPHGLEGFATCTLCHERGGPNVPQFPADHIGRTDDVCTACHSPAVPTPARVSTITPTIVPPATPTAIPTATPTAEPTLAPTEAAPALGDAARGQALYSAHCALCHGANGEGTGLAPKPLNSAQFLSQHTDEEIAQTIRLGKPGKMLPLGDKLSEQEILDIVALIRSWQ